MERDADTMTTKTFVDRVLTALYTRQPPAKVVMAATGGGASASELLFRSGSSSTMLHFAVPYAKASLLRYVGFSPSSSKPIPKFVSRDMAERMAKASFSHAQCILWDQESEDNASNAHSTDATLSRFRSAIGVGCTAALATNYERRGANHAFISICRAAKRGDSLVEKLQCETYYLTLDKTHERSREQEDKLVNIFVVYLLGKTAGVAADDCAELLKTLQEQELRGGTDSFEILPVEDPFPASSADEALAVLSSQTLTNVAFLPVDGLPDAVVAQDFPFRGIVLSGSFNPLHQGHVDLALAGQRLMESTQGTQLPVAFEIAVANADKGAIDTSTVVSRVKQFTGTSSTGTWPVLVTNATLFSQKAELLKGCVFVIGADTAVRLVDKKYYDQDEHKMVLALRRIADNGGSFVVAGRFDEKESKRFISADEVLNNHVPGVLKSMFVALREEDFRNDLSSTQIRNAQKAKAATS